MAENTTFILINKMPGYFRILGIEFFISLFNFFLICLKKRIFFWINKTGFKKEILKVVQIYDVANVRTPVFCLMEQR